MLRLHAHFYLSTFGDVFVTLIAFQYVLAYTTLLYYIGKYTDNQIQTVKSSIFADVVDFTFVYQVYKYIL